MLFRKIQLNYYLMSSFDLQNELCMFMLITCPGSSNNIRWYHRIAQEILRYREEVYQYLTASLRDELLVQATIYTDLV